MAFLKMPLQADADKFDLILNKEEFVGMNCHCLRNWMLLWQPYFYQHGFFICVIFLILVLNGNLMSHETLSKARSTRIRIFLNPQLFLSGFTNFPVHT